MQGLQHCPACQTEYVASARACVECGAALRAGPLPRYEGQEDPDEERTSEGSAQPTEAPTRALITLPGAQAERAAKLLTLEGIVCLLECEGLRRLRLPDEPVPEPIAVTLPVTVYVPHCRFADAQAIVAGLDQEDVIGEQWTDHAALEELALSDPATVAAPDDGGSTDLAEFQPLSSAPMIGPQPEGTTLRFIVLLALVAAVAAAVAFVRTK